LRQPPTLKIPSKLYLSGDMKLSDLVRFYNQLCDLKTNDVQQSADRLLSHIVNLSQHLPLENLRADVASSFDRFDNEFEQFKQSIQQQIREAERPYVQDSYRRYEGNRSNRYQWFNMDTLPAYLESAPEIRDRKIQAHVNSILNNHLSLSDEGQEIIMNRIIRRCGWQTTTMVLHPGLEPWLANMVANDPLYLVDESYDLLKPAMAGFNELQQRRLRTYAIKEDTDQDILGRLPDQQFGLILSWNYFNHRPFEIIRKYLTELYEKLRPGGILMMTYNDCDRWPGVVAVEAEIALYTPGTLIRSFAESLGFEQTFYYHEDGSWSWVEFQKPGEWESYRGGQLLARISPKPVA